MCLLFELKLNNISVILWLSVLLVNETRAPGENHQVTDNLFHRICIEYTLFYESLSKINITFYWNIFIYFLLRPPISSLSCLKQSAKITNLQPNQEYATLTCDNRKFKSLTPLLTIFRFKMYAVHCDIVVGSFTSGLTQSTHRTYVTNL
jgi:hypothetical protein